ncbi:MAG TPA: prepilin-type N-terminal cleavage/methylation domain-containing protein [Geminicoccaceae bacterium]|nr:prepilin-type N-terminal cleavage/methylation domain-containing protein [Geminicoccaceae bacterium]
MEWLRRGTVAPEGGLENRARSHGFTLVELLVVLATFGLLSLLLLGVLRFGVRAWETGVERVADEQEIVLAQSLLRRLLGQAQLLPPDERAEDRPGFLGGRERLRFVAPMPPHLTLGGFYVLALELNRDSKSQELIVRWNPYRPDDDPEDFGPSTESVKHADLLDDVESLSLEYFGARAADDDPIWMDSWDRMDALPQLVRVGVEFGDHDGRWWPDLVVALKAAEGTL